MLKKVVEWLKDVLATLPTLEKAHKLVDVNEY